MKRTPREQRTATLAGREVRYVVTTSPTAKKTRVRVGPGGVEVVVPRTAHTNRAAEFLTEQADWVVTQLDRIVNLTNIRRPAAATEPGMILLGGQRVPVQVVSDDTDRRYPLINRTDTGLIVRVPRAGKVNTGASLERWLRREARRVIELRVEVWARALKRKPNRIYIRGQRTKWGNCSKLRNLSFNWRLVMAPQDTLDAIAIHELAHLTEPTHEARFWLLVRSHCPDYDARVRWLATHQEALFALAPLTGDKRGGRG